MVFLSNKDEFELYNPTHKSLINYSEVNTENYDDVFLCIVGGCHTAEPETGNSMIKGMADAGVDVAIGWKNGQYSSRFLFVKYFFDVALEENYSDTIDEGEETVSVSWENFPTTDDALKAAYIKLIKAIGRGGEYDWSNADYVYDNCIITGTEGSPAPGARKLYPPRYGKKDIN